MPTPRTFREQVLSEVDTSRSRGTASAYRRMTEHTWLPDLGGLPVDAITRGSCAASSRSTYWGTMTRPPYLDVLARLHETVRPRTYLEIGVRNGWSLAQAREDCAVIGIDPAFTIDAELSGRVQLRRMTSDDYFAADDPRDWLGGPIELAFIDGMHLAEYALRDFINVERHCAWSSIVVFDDVLPRSVDEAARDRHTQAWTGDVFRVAQILAEHRPDLVLTFLDTDPTGLLLVSGLDPASRVLSERFDEIVKAHVTADPQDVPAEVLDRTRAVDVERVFSSPLLDAASARGRGTGRRIRRHRAAAATLSA